MADRNRLLRGAASIMAAAYLVYAVRDLITAKHVLDESDVALGFQVSVVIFPVVHLGQLVGFLLVAAALDREIDRRRFWIGGIIVAAAFFLDYVGWMFYLLPILDEVHVGAYRATYIATAIGTLAFALGVAVFVSGLAPWRHGDERGLRLRLGMTLLTVGLVGTTVALLCKHAYYSDAHSAGVTTSAILVQAVGSLGLALAALVFSFRIRRPFRRREAALVTAAAGAAVAVLCIAAGEALLTTYLASHGLVDWQKLTAWLTCGYRIAEAAAVLCVGLAARRAFAAAPPAPGESALGRHAT